MDAITNNVSCYIGEKKISVMHLAEKTGISYHALYDSLLHKERERELRAWEFMAICKFLDKKAEDFMGEAEVG